MKMTRAQEFYLQQIFQFAQQQIGKMGIFCANLYLNVI